MNLNIIAVDGRLVNESASSHDVTTVVSVNKLYRRRVLLTTRSTRRGEIF